MKTNLKTFPITILNVSSGRYSDQELLQEVINWHRDLEGELRTIKTACETYRGLDNKWLDGRIETIKEVLGE